MKISYDPKKSQRNIEERQISFDEMEYFDWRTAVIRQDMRFEYPEPRFIGLGFIETRLYVVVFTPQPDGVRIISLRKANKREVKIYEETFNQ